jgi:choice-of-anchor A domain-containing protein
LNGNSYSWLNFDVISFGGFTANTGDIEGRLAVRNSATIGSGWSVGYQTHSVSTDETLPYGLIVGGSLNWASGAAYPDGSNSPYTGAEEDIFVGGTFTGASYLSSRVTGDCSYSGCLNSQFDALQSCYVGYQNSLAALPDNVQQVVQWSGLYITCNDPSSSQYVISLTSSVMSQYTWISLSQCNSNARWIINLDGTDNMSITGGSFPAPAAAIIWNFNGSGRTLTISNTQVDGSILAPNNNVNQVSGVVLGKVIANNVIASLQVNKAQCFIPESN